MKKRIKAQFSPLRLVMALTLVLLFALPALLQPTHASRAAWRQPLARAADPAPVPPAFAINGTPIRSTVRQVVSQAAGTEIQLTPISQGLNNPQGLDHHQPSNKLVVLVNGWPGQPCRLQLVGADGTRADFGEADRSLLSASMVAVRQALAGFKPGELFLETRVPGVIARIPSDGSSVQNSWAVLPKERALVSGGLCMDTTGLFDGELIAVTAQGRVWRINSRGGARLIIDLETPAQGVAIVPDDADKYGEWAGKLLVGDPLQGGVHAVAPHGQAAFYRLGISPKDIDLIAADENLFAVDGKEGTLYTAPASALRG
ncbi:MAG TPA: hypothetical protein VIS78_06700, partial [Blastocatellia bacterium]